MLIVGPNHDQDIRRASVSLKWCQPGLGQQLQVRLCRHNGGGILDAIHAREGASNFHEGDRVKIRIAFDTRFNDHRSLILVGWYRKRLKYRLSLVLPQGCWFHSTIDS